MSRYAIFILAFCQGNTMLVKRLGLLLFLLLLSGCADNQGQQLFEKMCINCHGSYGRGDGPHANTLNPKPADLALEGTQKKNDEELKKIIQNGKPGTAMPPHEFSPEQLDSLVKFIRTLASSPLWAKDQEGPAAIDVSVPDPIKDAEEDVRRAGWPEEVRRSLKSVVRIKVSIKAVVKENNYFAAGSGTLIDSDLVLTTFHLFPVFAELLLSKNLAIDVYAGDRMIKGFFPDSRYYSPLNDLAVIKLKERTDFPPLLLARQKPVIGDLFYSLGYAFFDRPTVLSFSFKGDSWLGKQRFLVVSRSFEYGYSGAPMLNSKGELVGIDSLMTPKGVFGMVIPQEYINKLLEDISRR